MAYEQFVNRFIISLRAPLQKLKRQTQAVEKCLNYPNVDEAPWNIHKIKTESLKDKKSRCKKRKNISKQKRRLRKLSIATMFEKPSKYATLDVSSLALSSDESSDYETKKSIKLELLDNTTTYETLNNNVFLTLDTPDEDNSLEQDIYHFCNEVQNLAERRQAIEKSVNIFLLPKLEQQQAVDDKSQIIKLETSASPENTSTYETRNISNASVKLEPESSGFDNQNIFNVSVKLEPESSSFDTQNIHNVSVKLEPQYSNYETQNIPNVSIKVEPPSRSEIFTSVSIKSKTPTKLSRAARKRNKRKMNLVNVQNSRNSGEPAPKKINVQNSGNTDEPAPKKKNAEESMDPFDLVKNSTETPWKKKEAFKVKTLKELDGNFRIDIIKIIVSPITEQAENAVLRAIVEHCECFSNSAGTYSQNSVSYDNQNPYYSFSGPQNVCLPNPYSTQPVYQSNYEHILQYYLSVRYQVFKKLISVITKNKIKDKSLRRIIAYPDPTKNNIFPADSNEFSMSLLDLFKNIILQFINDTNYFSFKVQIDNLQYSNGITKVRNLLLEYINNTPSIVNQIQHLQQISKKNNQCD